MITRLGWKPIIESEAQLALLLPEGHLTVTGEEGVTKPHVLKRNTKAVIVYMDNR